MTVNPKKLRPYDEPPRRRRPLIPDATDSAATGFLVAAAIWAAIATGIGVLALGMRTLPGIELEIPLGVFDLTFQFEATRAQNAFVNATVYGWLSNVGFAAICFMTPRLLGRPLVMQKSLNVALGVWNLAVAGGIGLLYVVDLGAHASFTAFPWYVDGGLVLGALIVTVAFLRSAGSGLRDGYISLWYAAAALLALLALTTADAAISFVPLPDLTIALGSAYIGRSVEAFWLLGTALAILYYVVPRASLNPLYSSGIAVLGWVTWLVLAPLTGLGTLVDPSVPFAVTTIGAVATMLMLVPAFLAVINLVLTIRGRMTLLLSHGTVTLATISLAFLLATSLLQAIGALRSVRDLVGGTEWEVGVFIFGALGGGGLAAFAFADHALPRLLRREWSGGPLPVMQLWCAFAGAALGGAVLIGAGLAEGSLHRQAATPEVISAGLMVYRLLALPALGLAALGALALLINLFLMYTSGEPIEYALPGQATAATGH